MNNLYYRVVGHNLWHVSYSEATRLINKNKPYKIEVKKSDEMSLLDWVNLARNRLVEG